MNKLAVVIDAGARYGLHPTWQDYVDLFDFHLFEPDETEASRLTHKYAQKENIKVSTLALSDTKRKLTFNIFPHKGLNSIYEYSGTGDLKDYKPDETKIIGTRSVQASTIDDEFSDVAVEYIKMDIEGGELDALKGGVRQLDNSVLGLRAEVAFNRALEGAPQFGEINNFMLDHGFHLLNFDYTGQGAPEGKFTKLDRFGRIISTDAVWIAAKEKVFSGSEEEKHRKLVSHCLFLFNNNATDIAISYMQQAVTEYGVSFSQNIDCIGVRTLKRKTMLLFKELSYSPHLDFDHIKAVFIEIFGDEFPELNNFYEHPMFDDD